MAKQKDSLAEFEQRLEALKETHKQTIYMIAVPLDDTGKNYTACYISKPARPVLSKAVSDIAQGRLMEASETILRSCWIEGDEQIIEDDELFMSASTVINQIISFRQATLKKK